VCLRIIIFYHMPDVMGWQNEQFPNFDSFFCLRPAIDLSTAPKFLHPKAEIQGFRSGTKYIEIPK
jgi:hypothetical protein